MRITDVNLTLFDNNKSNIFMYILTKVMIYFRKAISQKGFPVFENKKIAVVIGITGLVILIGLFFARNITINVTNNFGESKELEQHGRYN